METTSLWLLFVLIGVGTFLIRVSFVQFYGGLNHHVSRLNRLFCVLPPAILATLSIPALFVNGADGAIELEASKLIAALMTLVAARYCKGVFWPILAGMGGLWISRWLL